MAKVLVVYHSLGGNTKKMAEAVAEGAKAAGAQVALKTGLEAGVDDLLNCDAVALGSPDYFSYMAGGLKDFLDRTYYPTQGKVTGKPCNGFKLTNNIMGFGLYGAGVDGGQNSLAEAFPGMTWDKNLFVGYGEGRARSVMNNKAYPAGSLFEPKQMGSGGSGDADWPAVGFADDARGDFRLSAASKYKGLGTDGKDLGADMDALSAALKGATRAQQPISGSTLNRRAGDSQDDGTIWAYRHRRARR